MKEYRRLIRSSRPEPPGGRPGKAGNAVKAVRSQGWLSPIAIVGIALIVTTASPQTQGPVKPSKPESSAATKPGEGIKVDVSLALVNVTVTDPLNRLVTGLEKDNFKVYEDGNEQEIVTLSSEDVPVSIGLVFDMSGSMSDKVDKTRQAAV